MESGMSRQLSESAISVVKATVPAIETYGLAITQRMYERMFENPAIRGLFNQSHHGDTGSQPKALAAAVLAYAKNIDNLAVLTGAVERIAQRHVGLNILPEHYPFVADALLGAIKDVLSAAATPEVLAAWGEAYWFLADILIGREATIYGEHAAAPGGWTGWRDFVIAEKRRESDVITSFVLRPADGGPILRHKPGQHLTFWLDLPGHAALKRNYSISSAPSDDHYRISVKREPQGLVSGWLHDQATVGTILKTAAPAGEFVAPDTLERPLVLVSGGVGVTPLLSMLGALASAKPRHPLHFVHAAISGATHALGAEARALAEASDGSVRVTTFYETPGANDVRGEAYDEEGRVTAAWLAANTPLAGADYYLCGPRPFLRAVAGSLRQHGVPTEQIRYEFFGPTDEALAA
jgi:nitric oxide dioxygenase